MFALHGWCVLRRKRTRRGSAAIELVLVLPFVSALLSIIFTIAAMTMTRMGLVTSVRNDCWQGRHQPWMSSSRYHPLTLDVTAARETERILGPTPRWPSRAAVAARDERRMPVYLAGLEDHFAASDYEHFVLAGSWDHQEIPFQPRAEHRRLEPTPKVYYFFDGPVSFAPFRLMADFASAASLQGQEAARQQHEAADARLQEELRRRRQEIAAALDQALQQLRSLQTQLDQLESQDPRDEEAIQRTREQMDALEADIRTMEDALAAIDGAGRATPP